VPEEQAAPTRRRPVPEFLRVPWTIGDVLLMIVLWIGIQLLIGIALRLLAPMVPGIHEFLRGVAAGSNITALLGLDVFEAVLGLGIIGIILRRRHAPWSSLGWRQFDVVRAVIYVILTLVGFVVFGPYQRPLVLTSPVMMLCFQAQSDEGVPRPGAACDEQ
jgi:hypothetical protein